MRQVEVIELQPLMLSVKAAAKYLGCTVRYLESLIAKGSVPCVRYSEGRVAKRYVSVESLNKFVEERRAKQRIANDPRNTSDRMKKVVKLAIARSRREEG